MRNREFEFLKRLNEFLEQPNLRLPELYETSLVVQLVRLHSQCRDLGSILDRGTHPICMPQLRVLMPQRTSRMLQLRPGET